MLILLSLAAAASTVCVEHALDDTDDTLSDHDRLADVFADVDPGDEVVFGTSCDTSCVCSGTPATYTVGVSTDGVKGEARAESLVLPVNVTVIGNGTTLRLADTPSSLTPTDMKSLRALSMNGARDTALPGPVISDLVIDMNRDGQGLDDGSIESKQRGLWFEGTDDDPISALVSSVTCKNSSWGCITAYSGVHLRVEDSETSNNHHGIQWGDSRVGSLEVDNHIGLEDTYSVKAENPNMTEAGSITITDSVFYDSVALSLSLSMEWAGIARGDGASQHDIVISGSKVHGAHIASPDTTVSVDTVSFFPVVDGDPAVTLNLVSEPVTFSDSLFYGHARLLSLQHGTAAPADTDITFEDVVFYGGWLASGVTYAVDTEQDTAGETRRVVMNNVSLSGVDAFAAIDGGALVLNKETQRNGSGNSFYAYLTHRKGVSGYLSTLYADGWLIGSTVVEEKTLRCGDYTTHLGCY